MQTIQVGPVLLSYDRETGDVLTYVTHGDKIFVLGGENWGKEYKFFQPPVPTKIVYRQRTKKVK